MNEKQFIENAKLRGFKVYEDGNMIHVVDDNYTLVSINTKGLIRLSDRLFGIETKVLDLYEDALDYAKTLREVK